MVLEYLTGAADVSAGRMEQLRRQLDAQLRPVLREREFAQFDLPRAIGTVHRVAEHSRATGSVLGRIAW